MKEIEKIILLAREEEAKRLNNAPFDREAYKMLGVEGMYAFDRVCAKIAAAAIALLLQEKEKEITQLKAQLAQ